MARQASRGDGPLTGGGVLAVESGAETDSCVEVATEPGTVHVRDSKSADGLRLAFAPAAWAGFVPYAVGS
ncbi:DUF397 domain-containing protein [Streptomyces sp. enrichment culture]|uniref:DUF397 domain-containing protein n=1 Tax=Streptomyces sp. enrichment culture TaxID=1795815 RepID=UPI003F5651C9